MKQLEINKFINYCKINLDFNDIQNEESYRSLPICIIDCVYSLRAQYNSMTIPVVERYANQYLHSDKYAETDTLENYLKNVDISGGCEMFANKILHNKQKLSGRIKTEICYEIADKLYRLLSINTLEDFKDYDKPELLDIVLRSVKGFGDAGINYLYMLAGDSNRCKPDVHIHHCIEDAIGKEVSNTDCQIYLAKTVEEIKDDYPNLTVKSLDYIIWNKFRVGKR